MSQRIAYSLRAAAMELRIPRALLANAVREGALRSYRAGNQIRLVTEDIIEWLRSLPTPPPKHRKGNPHGHH
jgi:excisionase family DNA binding protein